MSIEIHYFRDGKFILTDYVSYGTSKRATIKAAKSLNNGFGLNRFYIPDYDVVYIIKNKRWVRQR